MVIISAFPGTGKSYISNVADLGIRISDSDSSQFPKAAFPGNYIDHIKQLDSSIAFISSHREVRNALVSNRMPFFLVYPSADQKADYMERYRQRDSSAPFLKLMEEQFDNFVFDCTKQTGCVHVVLQRGQFLIDVLPRICTIAMTGNWTYSVDERRYTQEDLVGMLTLFAAYLTTLDESITVGANENAAPMVEIQKTFMERRGLHAHPNLDLPIVK